MKNFLKLSSILVLFAVMALSTSCKDEDTCYECTGFDDGMGTVLEDAGTICEGETDDNGGTYTKESLEAAVTIYEAFGGTCKKK